MIRKAENETPQAYLVRLAEYNNRDLIVEYAYPSSSTAKYYKMNSTGCYYISQKNPKGANLPRVKFSRAGFADEAEAELACKAWAEVVA